MIYKFGLNFSLITDIVAIVAAISILLSNASRVTGCMLRKILGEIIMNNVERQQLKYLINQLYNIVFKPLAYQKDQKFSRLYQEDGLNFQLYQKNGLIKTVNFYAYEDLYGVECIINGFIDYNTLSINEESRWRINGLIKTKEQLFNEVKDYIQNKLLPWFDCFTNKDKLIESILKEASNEKQDDYATIDCCTAEYLVSLGYKREVLRLIENEKKDVFQKLTKKIKYELEQQYTKTSIYNKEIDTHYYLTFRVNNKELTTHEERWKYGVDWMKSRGLSCDAQGWTILDLSHPNISGVMREIFNSPEKLQFIGWQFVQKNESNDSEWYLLKLRELQLPAYDSWIGRKVAKDIQIRAEKIPLEYHFFRDRCINENREVVDLILCSDKFRDACNKHHLTGIQFKWAKDISKCSSEQQYFVPFITHLIGKRIEVLANKMSECYPSSWDRMVKDSIDFGIHTESVPCFLRETLPNTDFAYYIQTNGELEFYISNRAYQCLKEEKVLDIFKDVWSGVEILENLSKNERGSLSNDKRILSDWEQVFATFTDNIKEYQMFIKKPRKKIVMSKESVLCSIKKLKKEGKLRSCASKKWRTKLQGVLPNELLEFYEIANGGMLSYNVEILEIQWIEEVNQEFREEVETATILQNEYQQIEELSKSGWIFAKSFYEDGKFFYLDGKVLYLSGRIGYSVAGEWDSIYEFLWDLLW